MQSLVCNAVFPCIVVHHHPNTPTQAESTRLGAGCLEGVVLRRYLVGEELVDNGNLLHNVIAHPRDLGEEEESKEAGYTTESGGESTAEVRVSQWLEWQARKTYYLATVPMVMPW